ncbi:MAG: WG repeat-containing protein [Flavobacteriia bacterium]|nr:WG repeat-containing protein [Flavobacteriia bacterium]OJX34821.1 MAG: hypothetical protein BGO87_08725 [Flavobacteriia bacterium 40-80]
MRIIKSLIVNILFLSISIASFARPIDKGFESLKIYNYFDAKLNFEKGLKKEQAIANYGLAIIYSRSDNPFHDFDKAYNAIVQSDQLYYQLPDKKRSKYKIYNFTRESIDSLKLLLASGYYRDVVSKENTEITYQRFIVLYPWADEYDNAITKRDSIAYADAGSKGTSHAYRYFFEKYPESELAYQAKANYYRLQYEEQTLAKDISSYVAFLANYPDNPYTEEAQDKIYDLYTTDNSIASFYDFTKKFPSNRNVESAWRKVYQMFMYDYSEKRFDEFIKRYPECPFLEEVKEDKRLAVMQLYPFRQNGKMGWMNMEGKVIYPAKYESLNFFKEGLAIASLRGKFGFVDKRNNIVIPIVYSGVYDFENGRAIVEFNNKFGIIDRTGRLVFDTIYTDIGQFSDELIYAQYEGKYYYFDKYGTQVFKDGFDEAFPFEDGKAEVHIGDKQTFINKEGRFLLKPVFEEVQFFNDSLFIVSNGEYYGLVNKACDTVLPLTYDEIGRLSQGKAIIALDDKFGYIDASGKIVIDMKYEVYPNYIKLAQFTDGIAKVKLKEKFGAIDLNGKVIIPLTYMNLGAVNSSGIAFTKGKQWGFITPKNVVTIQPVYDYAESFSNGYAVAELLVQQGVINQKQEWIIPNKYSEVRRFENNFWIAADGARLFLYTLDGKLISEDHYQQIRKIDEKTILLQTPTELHYYLIADKVLIRLKH